MYSALENAKRRLAELTKELEEIQTFISLHERYEKLSTGVPGTRLRAEVSPDVLKSGVMHRHSPRGGLTPKEIVELVSRILRESGQPLTRGEIVTRLILRDVDLPGEDKARYVGTIMWRHKSKFVNIEGRGYWLRGQPVPPPMIVPLPDDLLDPDDPEAVPHF